MLGDGSEPIDGGTVVIRDGRVVAAGANVAVPAGATMIDARGKWVTPGIVAGFSRIGLVEVDAVRRDQRHPGRRPRRSARRSTSRRRSTRKASTIAVSRAAGVTRAVVVAGDARAASSPARAR